jgi:phenylacetate-CoA ligase
MARLRHLVERTWREHAAHARWWAGHGLTPEAQLASRDDLLALPVITKQHYQALPADEAIARDYRGVPLLKDLTSGSTGVPVAIRRTRHEDFAMCAHRLGEQFRYGLGWFDLRALINTGLAEAVGLPGENRPQLWMRVGLLRRVSVNQTALGQGGVLRRLRELRPQALGGHAQAIWRLALEVPEAELRALRLHHVTLGAQTVTPEMQERVRTAFGCPAYNMYGASEFNLLASECPETGLLHLNEEGLIVEVLREGRPARDGEGGEVVATNLTAEAMPFIRYALNDWAVMGPERCPCGRPVRTLRSVQGRVAEFFHFSGGRKVHPFELSNPLLRFVAWMKEHRMVQTERDRVEVWFDVLSGAPEDAPRQVAAAVGAKAPAGVVVEAVQRSIPPVPERGKNKMFQPLGPQQ